MIDSWREIGVSWIDGAEHDQKQAHLLKLAAGSVLVDAHSLGRSIIGSFSGVIVFHARAGTTAGRVSGTERYTSSRITRLIRPLACLHERKSRPGAVDPNSTELRFSLRSCNVCCRGIATSNRV